MSTVCMHTVQDWTPLTFIVWTKKKKKTWDIFAKYLLLFSTV